MSAITNIYNVLETMIETALPTYSKIPNPYVVEDNPELLMETGYGLAIGPGNNTERLVGCKKTYEREFVIVLINEVTTTDTNLDQREALEKSIVEDHYKVFSAIEVDPDLGGYAVKGVLLNDSGIQYLDTGIQKYILIEISVTAEYFENL